MLPKSRIPSNLATGLYNPELINRDVNLNDLIVENLKIEKQEVAKDKIANRIDKPTTKAIPIPITEAEAEEADRQILNTQLRIGAMEHKIAEFRETVDQAISAANNGKELSFAIDISRKPRVKRALKKLFGEKLDKITYSQYIAMLKARTELENQEIEDYASGRFKRKK